MSSARRHCAFEFSLHASGAIIALLTLAATVSSGTVPHGVPATIASMLIVTIDADVCAEGPDASPAGRRPRVSRADEGTGADIAESRVRLGVWLLNIPPPAGV